MSQNDDIDEKRILEYEEKQKLKKLLDEKYEENPAKSGEMRLLSDINEANPWEVVISPEEMRLLEQFPRIQRAELWHQYNSLKDGYENFKSFLENVIKEREKFEIFSKMPILHKTEGEALKDAIIIYLIDVIKTISTTKSRLAINRFQGESLIIYREELQFAHLENRKFQIKPRPDSNQLLLEVTESEIKLEDKLKGVG